MRWTVIRRGITRTVLLTRRYAIKIPALRTNGDGFSGLLWSLARGVLANQAELAWKEYEPWQDALCPIVWSSWGGLVVVMPRCEPLEVNHLGEFEGELPKLEPNPGDDKPENYGRLNGRIVRLDYDMSYNACPHDRSGARNRVDYPLLPE